MPSFSKEQPSLTHSLALKGQLHYFPYYKAKKNVNAPSETDRSAKEKRKHFFKQDINNFGPLLQNGAITIGFGVFKKKGRHLMENWMD